MRRRAREELTPLVELFGYLPASVDGVATGFEVMVAAITEARRERTRAALAGGPDDGYLAALENSDHKLMVLCRDDTEIAAGRTFAETLARLAHGYFGDPQRGELYPL